MIDKHEQKYFFRFCEIHFWLHRLIHTVQTLKYMQMKKITLPDIQVNPELPKSVQTIK